MSGLRLSQQLSPAYSGRNAQSVPRKYVALDHSLCNPQYINVHVSSQKTAHKNSGSSPAKCNGKKKRGKVKMCVHVLLYPVTTDFRAVMLIHVLNGRSFYMECEFEILNFC